MGAQYPEKNFLTDLSDLRIDSGIRVNTDRSIKWNKWKFYTFFFVQAEKVHPCSRIIASSTLLHENRISLTEQFPLGMRCPPNSSPVTFNILFMNKWSSDLYVLKLFTLKSFHSCLNSNRRHNKLSPVHTQRHMHRHFRQVYIYIYI